jgi:23S rRNA (adenine2503-C2)-methyltransferase
MGENKSKKKIIGFSKLQLSKELNKFNIEDYRIKQLWNWIYFYGKTSFEDMNNISKDLRLRLSENYTIERPKILTRQFSNDGTKKWLINFDTKENSAIEMVYIPETDRGTLCLSSQVGCAMECKFCSTGNQGLIRNLTSGEIVEQLLIARDELEEWKNLNKGIGDGRAISNIVFMGMGEPLMNIENVTTAINIINDPDGIAFSNRRITLSTCGIAPLIDKLSLKVNLALSLHATNDRIRQKIMPIAKKYNIDEVLKSCSNYSQKIKRRITFEYVLIDKLNDSEDDARELIKLIKKYNIPSKFNLIPFNEWDGCEFKTSKNATKFAKIITEAGYPSPIRKARGQDIMAACGQLKKTKFSI